MVGWGGCGTDKDKGREVVEGVVKWEGVSAYDLHYVSQWTIHCLSLHVQAEMAEGEGKADDPFTRRKCQPTLVTLVWS